jgi:hypothetical protein
MNKRRGKERKRKNDHKERNRIYEELVKAGVKETIKAVKKMMEKGEKVHRLIEGVGKEKLRSMCAITTVNACINVSEIDRAIEYFKKLSQE